LIIFVLSTALLLSAVVVSHPETIWDTTWTWMSKLQRSKLIKKWS